MVNSLSLNVNKTVYIIFSGRKPVESFPNIILFNFEIISKKDTELSWEAQALFMKGKFLECWVLYIN